MGSSLVVLHPPLDADRVARLCVGASAALRTARDRDLEPGLVCVMGQGVPGDLATVDALARLALTARRSEVPTWVRGASNELRWLLAFVGLGEVLPCEDDASPVSGPGG